VLRSGVGRDVCNISYTNGLCHGLVDAIIFLAPISGFDQTSYLVDTGLVTDNCA
jgi:hypothetical protein